MTATQTTYLAKISAAIVRVQAEVKAAGKSGDNTFDRYTYAKLEDFLDAAKPALVRHGIALVTSIDQVESLPDRTTKNGGTEHAVRVRVQMTAVHESGESITVTCWGEGQDRADKAIYKAITGAKKYAVACLFAIPTTDDPEADEKVGLSDKRGSTAKIASTTGETVRKIPTWPAEQTAEIGGIFNEIYLLGGKTGEAEVKKLRTTMKYDPPSEVIDAAQEILRKFRDIADAANQGAAP